MKKIILIFGFVFAFTSLPIAANDTIPQVNNAEEEEFIRLEEPVKSKRRTTESQPVSSEKRQVTVRGRSAASNYESETTLRKGLEIQGDLSLLSGEMGLSLGNNWTASYRFTPQFAVGLGFGGYTGYDEWRPVFTNIIWNFTDTKFSPFAAFEAGICSYTYYEDYYGYDSESDVDLYLGVTGGVQYSFNEHFALKTNLKAAIGVEFIGFNIGLGVGGIYHF